MTSLSRDDFLVLAAVIITSAVALLRWLGLPPVYWMAAVDVPAVLGFAGWRLGSAARDVARLLRRTR